MAQHRNTPRTDELSIDDIELHIEDSLIDYDDTYAHEDWDDEALIDGAITPQAVRTPLGALALLHELPF